MSDVGKMTIFKPGVVEEEHFHYYIRVEIVVPKSRIVRGNLYAARIADFAEQLVGGDVVAFGDDESECSPKQRTGNCLENGDGLPESE